MTKRVGPLPLFLLIYIDLKKANFYFLLGIRIALLAPPPMNFLLRWERAKDWFLGATSLSWAVGLVAEHRLFSRAGVSNYAKNLWELPKMLILRSHPQINMSQEVIQGQKSALQLVHLGAFLPSPIWALPAKGLKVLAFSLACLQEAVSSWGCVFFL